MSAQLQLRAAFRFVDFEDQKLLVIGPAGDFARAIVHSAGPDRSYANGINARPDGGSCDGMLAVIPALPS